MAKSRKRDAGTSTEFGNLVRLDEERRAARREEGNGVRGERTKQHAGDWRKDLAEAGGEDWAAEQRKEKVKKLTVYSNLRTKYDQGLLGRKDLAIFLERFPSEVEYVAYQRLAEAIREGEIETDIENLKNDSEKTARKRTTIQRIRKPEAGGGWVEKKKNVEVTGKASFASLPPGGEEEAAEKEYRKILREYALGELTEKDVQAFFLDFLPEEKAAYEKLLNEIGKGEKPGNKLSREEVEEMLMRGLGAREELIKDIPTEEGKTLFREMMDDQIEIFKGAMLDTVSRADYAKKLEEAGGDRVKAEKELIAEEAKKFLAVRELYTHGVVGYNKEKGQIVLKHYSDLDGKCAIALFGKIGLDIKNVGYLLPGETREGQTTVDSGNFAGIETNSTETVDPKTGKRIRRTSLVVDHHAWPADRGTSATKNVFEVLTKLGLLKFEDERDQKNYEKVVEWVTQSDNFNFPRLAGKVSEKELDLLSRWINNKPKDRLAEEEIERLRGMSVFETSDLRMVGFLKSRTMTLRTLLNFVDSGKDILDILSIQDLKKFGLVYDVYKKKKLVERVDHTAERHKVIEETLGAVAELERNKWVLKTEDGKRFLVDTQNKIGGEGQWAAASLGFDGVVRYTPEIHNFFVALNEGTFDKKTFAGLSQGKLVRGGVFIKLAGGEKLTVTLGDLVGRIAPNFEPEKDSEFDKFLETEPRRIRAIVSQSPEGWWWANAPDGTKIIIFGRDIPKDFKSGQEAYVRLASPRPEEADDEQKERYGISKFYVGRLEADEIVLPKKVEVKKKTEATVEKSAEAGVPLKPEVKSEAPVAPKVKAEPAKPEAEKPVTPEDKDRKEREGKFNEAMAAEEERIFREFLGTLERSSFYGKWAPEAREKFARGQIKPRVEEAKNKLRKEYGL